MILKGHKVTLRAITKQDLPLLVDLMNDPEIENTVVGYAHAVSLEEEEKWFESYIGKNDPMRWMIETDKDGTVGTIIMGDFDWKNRVAHLTGIKIKKEKVTESGVAIDATLTMLEYGFNQLNLNRIEGSYLEYNKQSAALSKLVGYVEEGISRDAVYKNGAYHNLVQMAILKSDYEKLKKRKKTKKCGVEEI